MSKKIIFLVLALFVFLVGTAAVVDPASVVPTVIVTIVTTVLLPLVVEGLKLLVSKTGKDWLIGKTASTIYCWVIALILTVIYYNWKALPPLPSDPQAAATIIFLYGSTIAQIATNVYNALYAGWLDAQAKKPGSILAYKLK